jgi:aryl-alcohol dehydrogenase-like predicted oxidoreductase
MALAGKATQEGSARYRARFGSFSPDFFSQNRVWTCASLGIGTHGGALDPEGDRHCVAAIVEAVLSGANVVDTSSNYRGMRSEPAVAAALSELASQEIHRSEIIVATKGGFIPWDQTSLEDPRAHVEARYVRTGMCRAEDIVEGNHCLSPAFLQDQLGQSLLRLGLETIDIYFIHNPEFQLTEISHAALCRRLAAAFESLEAEARSGRIQIYGVATWNGLRVAPNNGEFLNLEELIAIAQSVAGVDHRFRAVQFPFSLVMPEALIARNQMSTNGKSASVLEVCAAHDLMAFTSVPLAQGQLGALSSKSLVRLFEDVQTPAQAALQFARSPAGVTTVLVGMTTKRHIQENLALAYIPRAKQEILGLF